MPPKIRIETTEGVRCISLSVNSLSAMNCISTANAIRNAVLGACVNDDIERIILNFSSCRAYCTDANPEISDAMNLACGAGKKLILEAGNSPITGIMRELKDAINE